jgi:glycosyltransferase involved in cell wall biosynthesis
MAYRVPRVLAVASHPIQYHAPWFRGLAAAPEIDFSVLFVQVPDAKEQGEGFGIEFKWDIPVLEGYRWQRVVKLRGRGGLRGYFAARIARPAALLREQAPDILLVTGWHTWALVQLVAAAARLRIPVVMRGEANLMRPRPWYTRLLHRWLLSRCAACLPIGQANRLFYRSYGVSDTRLFDAPYFVDNVRFAESARRFSADRPGLRVRWGIPADAVCYVYVGKLEPKKRILDLLDAVEIASRGGARLHLLVVGTGELEYEARNLARQKDLPVVFAGFMNQSEVAAAYVAADALVLASDSGETWGLVVNEAMACGRPAFVSDCVGCGPDLVVPGVTGQKFRCGDTEGLADLLASHASSRQALEDMGRRARELVSSRYGEGQAVAGTLKALAFAAAPA